MLAYIKSNYKTGDTVQITCSEGLITGEIEFVSNKYIVLRQPNGQIMGIAAEDVHTFTADCPVPLTPAVKPATQAPAETEDDEEDGTFADAATQSETAQPNGYGRTANYMEDRPTLEFNPKVVGKINLAQVDPKYGKRSFFRSSADTDSFGNAPADGDTPHHTAAYSGTRKPFVSARGRITYYNTEKRYGFIHDYTEDTDIYFHQSQVVDSALYDELCKGTKVAYTLGKNTQGLCAYCLHLPCTAESLLPLAEDFFDARRYQQAQSILQQILDADPDNTAANDLLEDIRSAAPAIHDADSAPFVPSPLYAQAKKLYLAKRVDEAEEAYLHAIEAGERVESCVKDLVTLYVSRYKQAEDPEEKANCKKKAMDFLDSHRDKLADNLTTKQFLALNYYLSLQEYDSFITVVDEILQDPAIQRVNSKRAFYIWQKAIVLNKLGRRDDALELIDEGLSIVPTHHQLRRLQQYILYPEQQGEAPVASAAPAEDGKEGETSTTTDEAKDNAADSTASSEDKGGSWWQQTLDTGW